MRVSSSGVYDLGVRCQEATREKEVGAFAAFGRWLSNTLYWVLDLVSLVVTPSTMSEAENDAGDAPSVKPRASSSVGAYTCWAEAAANGAFFKADGGESDGPGIYM
jgi:hypothetical protein